MKDRKCFFISIFALSLMLQPLPLVTNTITIASGASLNKVVASQGQPASALDRGYRTGYSDGYQAGWRDALNRATRDASNKQDYIRADRAYAASYGSLEDYRDGYQQGFEAGYDTGYDRRGFDSTIPADLARRSSGHARRQTSIDSGADPSGTPAVMTRGAILIPDNTTMRIELLHSLSTDASLRGDRFEARVLEPQQYEGATIEGRVASVRRPGKVRGTAELQLAFDQIRFTNNQAAPFSAQVMQVISHDEDAVGDVDREGGVRGKDSTRDDVKKVGSGAAIGAVIGAITGGGKGAAIGAVIGGAVGTGGAIASRGKDVRLERGQRLMIRTSGDTR